MVRRLLHLNTDFYPRRVIYKLPPCHAITLELRVRSLSLWRHLVDLGLIISISVGNLNEESHTEWNIP